MIRKPHPCGLALIIPEGAMQANKGGRQPRVPAIIMTTIARQP